MTLFTKKEEKVQAWSLGPDKKLTSSGVGSEPSWLWQLTVVQLEFCQWQVLDSQERNSQNKVGALIY
jgi:hypothetical protein